MQRRTVSISAIAAAALTFGVAGGAFAQDKLKEAEAFVAKYAGRASAWDGPTSGPKAPAGKKIVVLASDMKNGGVLGVVNGIQEAAKVAGWDVRVIDGQGSVSGRTAAFNQAITLKPDGLVINGFDAIEQKPGMEAAEKSGIPMVSWHAAKEIGPVPGTAVFANVTTDAFEVSKAAALWALKDAGGKPGVVIFTDSTYAIAIAKARKMEQVIKDLGGTVVEWVDTPIAETSTRMPQLTTSLLQRHGAKWTHSLAINDLYYDFMGPSLTAAGIKGDARPINVAAGDGSESAYQRVRSKQYQAVTVAEPLNLQGWQLVDELNRAFAKAPWSGYVSPLHVVTPENIAYDGGPKNRFDPDNGYRDQYKRIWGK